MTKPTDHLLTVYSDGMYYSELLTDRVQALIRKELGGDGGLVTVLLQHTTSAILLVEYEAGALLDIKEGMRRLLPEKGFYYHHQRGVDQNGMGHVLSGLLNHSLTIPVSRGELLLGTFQDILFLDFQPEPASRNLIVRIGRE